MPRIGTVVATATLIVATTILRSVDAGAADLRCDGDPTFHSTSWIRSCENRFG
jgi:hypothetical protein